MFIKNQSKNNKCFILVINKSKTKSKGGNVLVTHMFCRLIFGIIVSTTFIHRKLKLRVAVRCLTSCRAF